MYVLPWDDRLTFLELLAEFWIGGDAFAAWHFGSAAEQEEWTGSDIFGLAAQETHARAAMCMQMGRVSCNPLDL